MKSTTPLAGILMTGVTGLICVQVPPVEYPGFNKLNNEMFVGPFPVLTEQTLPGSSAIATG